MALVLEVRSMLCADLPAQAAPEDASDCACFIEVQIGHAGGEEVETFSFTAMTPRALARYREVRWGRGCLLMQTFSWAEVQWVLARLLGAIEVESWTEAVVELRQFMDWEFDDYAL